MSQAADTASQELKEKQKALAGEVKELETRVGALKCELTVEEMTARIAELTEKVRALCAATRSGGARLTAPHRPQTEKMEEKATALKESGVEVSPAARANLKKRLEKLLVRQCVCCCRTAAGVLTLAAHSNCGSRAASLPSTSLSKWQMGWKRSRSKSWCVWAAVVCAVGRWLLAEPLHLLPQTMLDIETDESAKVSMDSVKALLR